MLEDPLGIRTYGFALEVGKFLQAMSSNFISRALGQQLVRSSSSTAANYRAAKRSRSRAEFIAKISIVIEEADESILWLSLISDLGLMPSPRCKELVKLADEILAISYRSRSTARTRGPCGP
jgi:four helix bundle protein